MKIISAYLTSLALAGLLNVQNLPAAEQYFLDHSNVDFSIDVVREPAFPTTLLNQGYTEGKVAIAFEVDYAGELRDWIVTEASHPDFAKAIEQVIPSWDFSAPKINGESRSIVTRLVIDFRSTGSVLNFDLMTSTNARLNEISGFRGESIRIADVDRLDSPPRVRSVVKPAIPREALEANRGSKAGFTFYVDEEGRVRVPALSKIDGDIEPGMLLATQDALSQWRFEPPRQRQTPVSIKLAQTFVYDEK